MQQRRNEHVQEHSSNQIPLTRIYVAPAALF